MHATKREQHEKRERERERERDTHTHNRNEKMEKKKKIKRKKMKKKIDCVIGTSDSLSHTSSFFRLIDANKYLSNTTKTIMKKRGIRKSGNSMVIDSLCRPKKTCHTSSSLNSVLEACMQQICCNYLAATVPLISMPLIRPIKS